VFAGIYFKKSKSMNRFNSCKAMYVLSNTLEI
jgi:hypothetical protein